MPEYTTPYALVGVVQACVSVRTMNLCARILVTKHPPTIQLHANAQSLAGTHTPIDNIYACALKHHDRCLAADA